MEHNLSLFQHLDGLAPGYLDWQVTCLFYAALHLVDEYLLQARPDGVRIDTHGGRVREVRRLMPGISSDYGWLKIQSEDARYDMKSFTPAEVAGLFTGQFTRIRMQVHTALGLPL